MSAKTPIDSGPYLQEFRRWSQSSEVTREAAWLKAFREEGLDRFKAKGVPPPNHEDWRFTPLAPWLKLPFSANPAGARGGLDAGFLDQEALSSLSGPTLVFVDGCLNPDISSFQGLPEGVDVCGLRSICERNPDAVREQLNARLRPEENPFADLNGAFFQDGAWIRVAPGAVLADPVRLVHVSTCPKAGASSHTRNLIDVGEGAELRIVEQYLSIREGNHHTNVVSELTVGPSARVELVKYQDESSEAVHLSTLLGRFDRESQVRIHSISLGAKLARNTLRVELAGPELECVLNGLYLTRGEQLADHHMIVEHLEPRCASHEYFNGILDERSRGVFHGRILVHPTAQKTDAKQTNKNLLLSDDATANTKPQLEIYADDVRCTHGATVGQLNEDSIFYLRARGIGLETARQMLIHAFAGEIIGRISHDATREAVDRIIWDHLESNPHIAAAPSAA